MQDNKCLTCKHWEQDRYKYLKLGVCNRIGMFWEQTDWNENGDRVITTDSKAFAQDGSDYSACLLTLSDFGCVMYESK